MVRYDRKRYRTSPTPEKRAWLLFSLSLQIHTDGTHGFNCCCAGRITREHYIKVRQVAITQTLIEVCNLLRGCTSAFELPIAGVVACIVRQARGIDSIEGNESKDDVLKCTVFKAATSHPMDCMTNVAMVFPTWLADVRSFKLCLHRCTVVHTHRRPDSRLAGLNGKLRG